MPAIRRKYDAEFREGAVTIVRETGKPIVEVAREPGISAGTLGNWVKKVLGPSSASVARHRGAHGGYPAPRLLTAWLRQVE